MSYMILDRLELQSFFHNSLINKTSGKFYILRTPTLHVVIVSINNHKIFFPECDVTPSHLPGGVSFHCKDPSERWDSKRIEPVFDSLTIESKFGAFLFENHRQNSLLQMCTGATNKNLFFCNTQMIFNEI